MTETIRYSYKLIVVGDPSVGKTSLIRRYADRKFDESYLPTIGADFTIKQIEFKEANVTKIVTLSIWDMGGHQRFERIRNHYYLDSNAAFIVCDLGRKETFNNLATWLNDVITHCDQIPTLILANKNDLPEKEVLEADLAQFASNKGLKIYTTSAKTGENVDKAFKEIAALCLKTYD
ncbi:MAG: Rab family GTPase [Candidatus Helarchaeota archaeon]